MSLLDSIKKTIQRKPATGAHTKKTGGETRNEKPSVKAWRENHAERARGQVFFSQNAAASYHTLLRYPHITEKSVALKALGNKYVFKVAHFATKRELRKAVETIFKVKVVKVHTITMPTKSVKLGKTKGKRPGFKKAIITLQKGHTLESGV